MSVVGRVFMIENLAAGLDYSTGVFGGFGKKRKGTLLTERTLSDLFPPPGGKP